MKNIRQQREKRHKRVRSRVKGLPARPRLSVFRSAKYIYTQVIDDVKGQTLAQFNDSLLTAKTSRKIPKSEKAKMVGRALGEALLKKEIKTVVFDRGGYKYHGRVKALAEGLREAGVKF